MRRLAWQRKRAAAHGKTRAFFPSASVKNFNRQSLIFRLERSGATKTNRKLPLREPIDHLPRVATERDVLVAEELADKRRAKLGMIIKELHGVPISVLGRGSRATILPFHLGMKRS